MRRLIAFAMAGLFISVQAYGAEPGLKDAFKGRFLIGAALNPSHFMQDDGADAALIDSQFNSITPENVMKWESIHPGPGRYNFAPADRYVAFGERHGMFIVAHNLVWHNQTPAWVFRNDDGTTISREGLLDRMHEHIKTVVGRYKGRVNGWDVVNEALTDDGALRDSMWRRIIGDDYIVKAFEFAHEADPKAELYYNDFGIENRAKRKGAIKILKQLQAAGTPATGIGIQEHVNLEWPSTELLDEAISDFAAIGAKVMITELDIDMLPGRQRANESVSELHPERGAYDASLNPYRDGLPEAVQAQLAARYAALFKVYLKHSDAIERVTFWGVTDRGTWLDDFPLRGRTAYPLLFDRQGKPEPAYRAVIETATGKDAAAPARQ